jgi:hypothetical protein
MLWYTNQSLYFVMNDNFRVEDWAVSVLVLRDCLLLLPHICCGMNGVVFVQGDRGTSPGSLYDSK